jgi:hypothetical protein
MNRILSFAAAAILAPALGACASQDEAPRPDPEQLERLLATLEAQAAPAAQLQGKLPAADRALAALDRSDPQKLGGLAENVLR